MKKKLLFFLICIVLGSAVSSTPVSQSKARIVATNFWNTVSSDKNPQFEEISSELDLQNMYVFVTTDNNGFVIVAADDVATPILGYSTTNGILRTTELPNNFRGWITHYSDEIQYARDNGVVADAETASDWQRLMSGATPKANGRTKSVTSLIETQWDQDSPYNLRCPYDNNGGQNVRSVTGQVATAMAQVMKYWEWPIKGTGNKSYTCSSLSAYVPSQISASFDTNYAWTRMPEGGSITPTSTWNAQQKKAVALLMFHCGVSVSTEYGYDGSVAVQSDVPDALKNYFYYASTATYKNKNNSGMSSTEWETMLKNELDALRPVIYSGALEDGSRHSFVCDGYNTENFFHFNFGWSGECNGVFRLDEITPTIAYASYSFNYQQECVIGITPGIQTTQSFTVTQTVPVNGTISGSCGFKNSSMKRFEGYLGVAAFDANDEMVAILAQVGSTSLNANATTNLPFSDVPIAPLTIGSYTAKAICSVDGTNWVPIVIGHDNCPTEVPFVVTEELMNISVVSSNTSMGSVSGGGNYPIGSTVTISAIPNSGYHFTRWQDNNTSNPRSITVTTDATYTAYFEADAPIQYTITTASNDPSMGSVTGGGSYVSGSTATLTAVANSGYHFTRWQDNNTNNPRIITVTTDATYTAYFESDGGGEQPSDNAPSIACVGVDMTNHNVVRWEPRQGTSPVRYNIYREGLGGYSIVGYVLNTGATDYSWVDDNSNTATQAYSYKLSEVTANGTESDLSLPHKTIHLQISQGQGSTWNLSWTPYVGFNYSGYRIFRGTTATSMSLLTELSSSATTYSDNNAPSGDVYYQIEVAASNGAKSIVASSRSNIATSVQSQQFTLTVLSGNTSMGTVSGGGTFVPGATATISATPLSGYTFTQWSDGSTQAQRTITVMGDATYTAFFSAGGSQPQQYLITVNSIDETMGTVTGGGLFDEGTITTIMATAKPGYQFVQWQDGNTQDIRTITVTADATYTAYFRADGTQGIDDVSAEDVKVFARGMEIVVEGCEGDEALVYDVTGRVMHRGRVEGPIRVGAMGVYMVKVGERQPRKVVVR